MSWTDAGRRPLSAGRAWRGAHELGRSELDPGAAAARCDMRRSAHAEHASSRSSLTWRATVLRRAGVVRARARAAVAGRGGAGAGDAVALSALVSPLDLVAGVTVGAVAVPSSLAMAELAGLPVVYGLYGTFLPLAVYALLGTSRQHVIGPDSTLAALTAVTVAPLAMVGAKPTRRAMSALAAALALAMGAAALPGRRVPAGVHRGLLRQAGAARLHQRGRADRDLVPARQAPWHQRRRPTTSSRSSGRSCRTSATRTGRRCS